MKLWLCGQILGEPGKDGRSSWDFQGVFDEESKAVAACRDGSYFIFAANINEALPHEPILPAEAYYPVLETKEEGMKRMEQLRKGTT